MLISSHETYRKRAHLFNECTQTTYFNASIEANAELHQPKKRMQQLHY